jgi:predicted O-methyltransferase YrrM
VRLSRLYYWLYLAARLVTNLVGLPYSLLSRPERTTSGLRTIVDAALNLEPDPRRPVQTIGFADLYERLGRKEPCLSIKFAQRYGNVNLLETLALAYLAGALEPRAVFEIGTYDGFSAYHLARNGRPDARVYTLNLPVEEARPLDLPVHSRIEYAGDNLTHRELHARGLGSVFKNSEVADRVSQLIGDSLTFDFSPYRGQIDLVFIDGGHSYEHVSADSQSAFGMLSSRGVIVWHDFNVQHRDIHRYLRELGRDRRLYHLAGTRLVLYFAGEV